MYIHTYMYCNEAYESNLATEGYISGKNLVCFLLLRLIKNLQFLLRNRARKHFSNCKLSHKHLVSNSSMNKQKEEEKGEKKHPKSILYSQLTWCINIIFGYTIISIKNHQTDRTRIPPPL